MNIEQIKNTLREFQAENRRKFKNTQAELKKAVSYIKKKVYATWPSVCMVANIVQLFILVLFCIITLCIFSILYFEFRILTLSISFSEVYIPTDFPFWARSLCLMLFFSNELRT